MSIVHSHLQVCLFSLLLLIPLLFSDMSLLSFLSLKFIWIDSSRVVNSISLWFFRITQKYTTINIRVKFSLVLRIKLWHPKGWKKWNVGFFTFAQFIRSIFQDMSNIYSILNITCCIDNFSPKAFGSRLIIEHCPTISWRDRFFITTTPFCGGVLGAKKLSRIPFSSHNCWKLSFSNL